MRKLDLQHRLHPARLVHDARSHRGELVDGTEPGWFSYGLWHFFIRFISPAAVSAIIVVVLFFGARFS